MVEKVVKVTNKGMISIPADIRKKHNIKDGDYVLVEEDENGIIKIVLIETVETLRKKALPYEKFLEIYKKSCEEDQRLEE
ncbi:MAG: AbrB/MazE/SpoVT family DNA-binding domain-containing protein [Candidatus Helarchaeota archaeon]